jgi:cytochrome c
MTRRWRNGLAALAMLLLAGAASGQERGNPDEARAMVDDAVAYVGRVGPGQAFKDFTDRANTTWHRKDLYVFAYTLEGVSLAHGANERLVGKNLMDVRDPNGKFLVRELRDMALKGGGWVTYDWPHPYSRRIEAKTSYVRKLVDFDGFVGVGISR